MGNVRSRAAFNRVFTGKAEVIMRSILLWAVGVPIPLILLLAFCTHHL
jgi:hypothetical protein